MRETGRDTETETERGTGTERQTDRKHLEERDISPRGRGLKTKSP